MRFAICRFRETVLRRLARSLRRRRVSSARAGGRRRRRRARFLRTLPGRLFLLSGVLLLVLARRAAVRSRCRRSLDVFRKVVVARVHRRDRAGWRCSAICATARALPLARPAQADPLVSVCSASCPSCSSSCFVLVGGVAAVHRTSRAYVFHEGFHDLVDDVQQIAETSAIEIGRNPAAAAGGDRPEVREPRAAVSRSCRWRSCRCARLGAPAANAGSRCRDGAGPCAAGAWRHRPPPDARAAVGRSAAASGFRGVVTFSRVGRAATTRQLVDPRGRADARRHADRRRRPAVDTDIVARLQRPHRRADGRRSSPPDGVRRRVRRGPGIGRRERRSRCSEQTVAFMDCTDWATGTPGASRSASMRRAPPRTGSSRQVAQVSAARRRRLDPFAGRCCRARRAVARSSRASALVHGRRAGARRSPPRSTSSSSAPSASGRATSRIASRSSRAISSAIWPSRSTA